MATYTSLAALQAALTQKTVEAVTAATEKSYKLLQQNVTNFYASPQGTYQRTGMLQDAPRLDGISSTGSGAVGQISINTGTQYCPAGRDTATIYGYAEDGGLLGNGNFWKNTEAQIQGILDSEVAKRFG